MKFAGDQLGCAIASAIILGEYLGEYLGDQPGVHLRDRRWAEPPADGRAQFGAFDHDAVD